MNDPSAPRGTGLSRRAALRGAAAATAAVAAGMTLAGRATPARAHNMPLSEFQDAYEAAVSRPGLHYQLYQFPNIANPTLWDNIRNGLNGSEFSYGQPPGSLRMVVQAYVSGNIATYNDLIWEKYQLGAKHNVTDPQTGQPATRNIFYPRKTTGGADLPPSDPQSFYNDAGMAALIERGVVFLT
ncbi:MAG: hypothetical protein M3O34_16160 [Chloroflexota bacterium]|nr:hypothetical protein [Chloroflexota bacterium]